MLIEKDNLLPYEEAKLFGHNAIHALLAYLGAIRGYQQMSELRNDSEIMQIAEDAFINESGAALIKKYASLQDHLFTEAGFRAYADDLLVRMTNPYLDDTIERAGRDPVRKLGLHDRLFGAMMMCLEQGITPKKLAMGGAAGIIFYAQQSEQDRDLSCQTILTNLWQNEQSPYQSVLFELVNNAYHTLRG